MSDSISTKEAAELLEVTVQTVQKWCRAGKIEGADQRAPGCPWRIPKDAILPVKKKNKRKGKED